MQIAIIGGGAAGFMGAITAAETAPDVAVHLFERGKNVLEKVRISGGGRCNVTHACFDAHELVRYYPRGNRELLGPFLRFGPTDTIQWFEKRGVPLKTEADGRMFPVTDRSATIVDCLTGSARKAGVQVHTGVRISRFSPSERDRWLLESEAWPAPRAFDRLLVTPGSSTAVWDVLAGLGHTLVPPVPSLFTFNTKDTRLRDLAGVSVPRASLSVPGHKLLAEGPLLVTHWGLSGPAVLRLSAWGARVLAGQQHRFSLIVNWTGIDPAEVPDRLVQAKNELARKTLFAQPLFNLPARLWHNLLLAAGIAESLRWADVDHKRLRALSEQLAQARFEIAGKSTFKEEFVTAGGVDLKEIDFKTFQSKRHPGLFLAGEVLDIDAVTGGFNFQAAWTGGWIAGLAASGYR
ncbi:MAG: NAD(P)/FAD-dependent oxidoreductase [Saprospiraceae bacterium]|nr:NAD(P)/FAD-dependent oxidoreductase [Saprospiraceae bacterium]